MPVRFGVVGCGGAALDVCRGIQRSEIATLVATFDLDRSLAEDLAAPFRARVHDALDGLLQDDLDAVYVALPHDLLAPTAERVLRAGHGALVEKPMALSLDALDRLEGLAASRGLPVGVVFELRHTGPAVVARDLVHGGALGPIVSVRLRTLIDKPISYWVRGPTGRSASSWRASRERAGGGVALMNSIHQLDLVHAIADLVPVDVIGLTGTLVADAARVEVEDSAAAAIRWSNGAIGSLVAGAHVPGMERGETIELDGRDGALRMPDPYAPGDCSVFLRRAWGELPAGHWVTIPSPVTDPFRTSIDAFAMAVRDRVAAPVGVPAVRPALGAVLALYSDAATRLDRPTVATVDQPQGRTG